MLLGVIADDFTGATDIAGFLVASGISTAQVIGVPPENLDITAEAVVVSLKSRSCPVEQAVSESLASLAWLRRRNCAQVFQKYCSTFDSTPQGNIGPVADALLAALGADFTVVCPALPVNGRTIYNGHLFVGGVPLAESGMRHHPVTPMTDSSLVRLMDAQSRGTTGVVRYEAVQGGVDAVRRGLDDVRRAGHRYAVLDALDNAHLDTLGTVVAGMPLVTGGSGLIPGMAKMWADRLTDPARAADAGRPQGRKAVVLAGSCSTATNKQVTAYRAQAPACSVDPESCIEDPEAYAGELARWVMSRRDGQWAPLVYATTDPTRLHQIQNAFGARASAAIEAMFAALAARLGAAGFDRFIVAGGETSGAVVQALGVTGLHIGPQIAPGVPWVRAIDKPYSLALKSGNFGPERFFFDCQA